MERVATKDDEVVAERLTALGLPFEAARTYLALTHQSASSIETLCRELDLDEAEVTNALSTLHDQALVLRVANSGSFRAIPPRAALGRLLDERARTLREEELRLLDAKREATLLAEEMDTWHPAQQLAADHAADPSASLFNSAAEARESIWNVVPFLPDSEMLRSSRVWDMALLQRGINLRVLVMAGHLRRSKEYLEYERALRDAGAEVRALVTEPTRLLIVDQATVIIPGGGDAGSLAPVCTDDPSTVAITVRLFEELWSKSLTLEEALGGVPTQQGDPVSAKDLTPLEQSIVSLMAQGEKDETVARRVGMSLRAVRRVIAHLTEEAGADSRFAFGVECARRGWV